MNEQHERHRPPLARVVTVIASLLAVAAAVVVTAAVVVVAVLPLAVGGQAMTVLTGSMEPSVPTGSVALVRPVDPQTVEVGDVLTYQVRDGEEVYITHRLIEVREDGPQTLYVLQGDANAAADDPILGDRIRGEVWFSVPYLGAIRDGLHGRGGVYLVATLLLAWFALAQIGAGLRERREERNAPAVGATGRVVLDRTVVLVELTTARLEVHPVGFAALHGGRLLRTDDESCVLLFVVEPTDLDGLVRRLDDLEPLTLQVAGPGSELTLLGRRSPESLPEEAELSA